MEVVKNQMEGVSSFLRRSSSSQMLQRPPQAQAALPPLPPQGSSSSTGIVSKVLHTLSGGDSGQVRRNTQKNLKALTHADLADAEFTPMLRKVNSRLSLSAELHTSQESANSLKSVKFHENVEEICFEAAKHEAARQAAEKHEAVLELLGISGGSPEPEGKTSPEGEKDLILEAVKEAREERESRAERVGSVTLVPISPCTSSFVDLQKALEGAVAGTPMPVPAPNAPELSPGPTAVTTAQWGSDDDSDAPTRRSTMDDGSALLASLPSGSPPSPLAVRALDDGAAPQEPQEYEA
jgi:hypothetical protein